ncbi:SMC family ATPase [uncultured Pseudoramibacter sp.]|uniref:AAA family ATPase n=1 Tax=uncultured Pseudoramibacter sp. TaxID=1623493 RepID=UPI002600EB37|nr:SMC family ATPase [uncultured Pseudoramibacter sp.]
MRPISLHLQCFGPFLDQRIDFSALKNHLFLISGPTGSGKSTLFDGICYALYGETSTPGDRPIDTIKSDFADPGKLCCVSFVFRVGPKTYKIYRQPRQQAFNRQNTRLVAKAAEAALWECDASANPVTLLESSVKACNDAIHRILGLSAEQFRQIVMLPQGQFSQLLKAKDSDRVALLKTLFSMAGYKRFEHQVELARQRSIEAFERLKSTLQVEIDHLQYKPKSNPAKLIAEGAPVPHLLRALEQDIDRDERFREGLEKEQAYFDSRIDTINRQIEKDEALIERFHQKKYLLQQQQALEEQQDAIEKNRRWVALSRKVLQILPVYRNLMRQQQREAKSQEALAEIKAKQADTKQQIEALRPQLETVSSDAYAQDLKTKQDRLSRLTGAKTTLAKLTAASRELAACRRQMQQLDAQRQQREALEAQMAESQKQIHALSEKRNHVQGELIQKGSAQNETRERLTHLKELGTICSRMAERQKAVDANRLLCQNSSAEIAKLKLRAESLENKLKATAAGRLAQTLTDGEPCPVCGAVHHPAPAPNTELDAADKALRVCREQLTEAQRAADTAQGQIDLLSRELTADRQVLDERTSRHPWMAPLLEGELDAVRGAIRDEHKRLSAENQANQSAQEKLQENLTQIERQLDTLTKTAAQNEKILAQAQDDADKQTALQSQIDQKTGAIDQLKADIDAVLPGLTADGGAARLDAEIAGLQKQVDDAAGRRDTLRKKQQQLEKDLASASASTAQLEQAAHQAKAALEQDQQEFNDALSVNGLTREVFQVYESHDTKTLTDQIQSTEQKIARYDENVHTIQSRLDAVEEELAGKTMPDLSQNQTRLDHYKYWHKRVSDAIADLTLRVKTNTDQIARIRKTLTRQQVAEHQKRIACDLYDTVKGKVKDCPKISFERYILSAYLQDILLSANTFLEDMSDSRYHLTLADQPEGKSSRGLTIQVYDDFTGKERPAASLSGGETFMAALSMALGLSDRVQSESGGIQLDTLFIDEGFATLDADALDNAMNCLARLQRNGRVIGIISHVSELLDLVDDKIIVRKTEGGSYVKVVSAKA